MSERNRSGVYTRCKLLYAIVSFRIVFGTGTKFLILSVILFIPFMRRTALYS